MHVMERVVGPLLLPYLGHADHRAVGCVCRAMRSLVALHVQRISQCSTPRRSLTEAEIGRLIAKMRASHIGPLWAISGTIKYVQAVLPTVKEFPADVTPDYIDEYINRIVKLYLGCMVAPHTSVGALDTTRTIERLTQARLSRFHTTGSVHVSFLKSGSLDSMLHPLSTSSAPRMLVALKGSQVDTSCAASVIESIRGVLVSIELAHVVEGPPRYTFSSTAVPAVVHRLCRLVTTHNNEEEELCCLVFTLRTCALFHHRITPHRIAQKINEAFNGIVALVLYDTLRSRWVLYVATPSLRALGRRAYKDVFPEIETQLPSKDACQDVTVNVIFDTGSTGIPQRLKHPSASKVDIDGMVYFLQYPVGEEGSTDRSRVRRRGASLSSLPTEQTRWSLSNGFAILDGSATKTRRRCFSGARKQRGGDATVDALPGDRNHTKGQDATESFVTSVIKWFGHVFSQVLLSFEANPSLKEDSGISGDHLRRVSSWKTQAASLLGTADGVATTAVQWRRKVQDPLLPFCSDDDHLLFVVGHVLMRCVMVFGSVPAASGRTESIAGVFNETVYHTCGNLLAQPYMQYRVGARLLTLNLCGLPGVRNAVASYNSSTQEWVVLTEGSAFREFVHQARYYPQLDVHNSTTTSIPEIVDLLGIEACYSLFTSGSLASSLGVNNHCCKMLSSHISQRGLFRGVNRSSILHHDGPIDAITVEDPAKHVRDAAIMGALDNCQGSSANILLGKSVKTGTAAFDLLYPPV
jgi:hypothetical protein